MSKNYYEVLGITPTSEESAIKKAYHKQALKYHPDKYNNLSEDEKRELTFKQCEQKFQDINEAYAFLSDQIKRTAYNALKKEEARAARASGGSYAAKAPDPAKAPSGSYTARAPSGSYTARAPSGSYTARAPSGSYTARAPSGSYTARAPETEKASGASSRRSSTDGSPSSTSASSGSRGDATPPKPAKQAYKDSFFKAPATRASGAAASSSATDRSEATRETTVYFFPSPVSAVKFYMAMQKPDKTHGPIRIYAIDKISVKELIDHLLSSTAGLPDRQQPTIIQKNAPDATPFHVRAVTSFPATLNRPLERLSAVLREIGVLPAQEGIKKAAHTASHRRGPS